MSVYMRKKHNKSGLATLSILELSNEEIDALEDVIEKKATKAPKVVYASRCKVWPNIKSKITLRGKVC
jgi:F0F1-type ATP synthase delta subunit